MLKHSWGRTFLTYLVMDDPRPSRVSLHYTTDPQTSMSKFSCAFVNQLCLPSYQLTLSPVLCHSPLTGLWQREYKSCLICKTNNENVLYSLKKLHCHLLKYIASSFHFVTLLTMSKNVGIYKLSIIYIYVFFIAYISPSSSGMHYLLLLIWIVRSAGMMH